MKQGYRTGVVDALLAHHRHFLVVQPCPRTSDRPLKIRRDVRLGMVIQLHFGRKSAKGPVIAIILSLRGNSVACVVLDSELHNNGRCQGKTRENSGAKFGRLLGMLHDFKMVGPTDYIRSEKDEG